MKKRSPWMLTPPNNFRSKEYTYNSLLPQINPASSKQKISLLLKQTFNTVIKKHLFKVGLLSGGAALLTQIPYYTTLITTHMPTKTTTTLCNPKILSLSVATTTSLFLVGYAAAKIWHQKQRACHSPRKKIDILSIFTPSRSHQALSDYYYGNSLDNKSLINLTEYLKQVVYQQRTTTKLHSNELVTLKPLIIIHNDYSYLTQYPLLKEKERQRNETIYQKLFKDVLTVSDAQEAYTAAEGIDLAPHSTNVSTICVESAKMQASDLEQLSHKLQALNRNNHRFYVIVKTSDPLFKSIANNENYTHVCFPAIHNISYALYDCILDTLTYHLTTDFPLLPDDTLSDITKWEVIERFVKQLLKQSMLWNDEDKFTGEGSKITSELLKDVAKDTRKKIKSFFPLNPTHHQLYNFQENNPNFMRELGTFLYNKLK